MNKKMKWAVGALVVLLLAAAVARTLAARKASQQALQAQLQQAQQQPSLELKAGDVVAAQQLTLEQTLAVSGAIKAVNAAFVKARVAGELQALQVREGEAVRAGQLLGRIDATEYQARLQQARQQAESVRAQLEIAQRSLDNNQALVNQGFISRNALDTSQSNLLAAQANYRAAQAAADVAQKTLDDSLLRAPIAGQVAQRLAQAGERVAVDTRVLEIVDLRALELEAPVSAADSVRIQPGQTAQLRMEGLGQPLVAKVARINPSTVAGSRSVLVYFSLAQASGLRQGLFAEGQLQLGTVQALAVPLDALRTDKPQPYVQLLQDGKVVHQDVTPGAQGQAQGQAMVEVKGLPAGAQVLRGSVGALRAGTLVKSSAGAS